MTLDINGRTVEVEIAEVAPGTEPQHKRERQGVAELVKRVFGREASIIHTSTGAPILTGSQQKANISISHGADIAAIAYSDMTISPGIDVEAPRRQLCNVASRFLTETEAKESNGILERLLDYWTAKEAVYKAALTPGLPLKAINVDRSRGTAMASGRIFALKWIRRDGATICVAAGDADFY